MHNSDCHCINCIVPPHLLDKLLDSQNKEIRQSARNTLALSATMRGERNVRSLTASVTHGDGRRTILDCEHRTSLSQAKTVMTESGMISIDETAKRAFAGLGATRDFYRNAMNRDSIDNNGMRLDGFVHYDEGFNNAFWDGQRMVFGDGDGVIFTDFTKSLDVIGHELTHGVTQFTAGLEYHDEPGALNESISDVFGCLVKQFTLRQTADQADWLIGADIMVPPSNGFAKALRSMAKPGSAYSTPDMGKDPQPDHYKRYDRRTSDNGGVHINSGIPNKAFYEVAIGIGGHAWEAAGHIWYEALLATDSKAQFVDFADTTYLKAGQLYGPSEKRTVLAAWKSVGVPISATLVAGRDRDRERYANGVNRSEEETLVALAAQIKHLSEQVELLSRNGGGRAEAH